MKRSLICCLTGLVCLMAFTSLPALSAQVEVDRIVSRVGGRVITMSDIRQARALKLVEDTASDDAVRRGLENRLLILNELSRAAPLPPASDDDLRARRGEWQTTIGGGGDVASVLRQAGMSEAELDGWLRDDLRTRAYLGRQFGMLAGVERQRAAADWIARLRQRADLTP